MEIVLQDSEYTFDASAKTVTLAAPYTTLSTGQIISIIDLTTNDILYSSETQRIDAISITGDVITHAHGIGSQADADKLQITIDVGGSAALPIHVDVTSDAEVATTPVIYNVTMTVADTEYSQALPANTKKLELRCQDVGFVTRYAFETGKVATPVVPYGFMAAGEVKTVDGLNLTSKTLYIACEGTAKVMQIECWT